MDTRTRGETDKPTSRRGGYTNKGGGIYTQRRDGTDTCTRGDRHMHNWGRTHTHGEFFFVTDRQLEVSIEEVVSTKTRFRKLNLTLV